MHKISVCFTNSIAFGVVHLLVSLFHAGVVVFHCGLNSHFLDGNAIEHFSLCFLAFSVSYFVNCLSLFSIFQKVFDVVFKYFHFKSYLFEIQTPFSSLFLFVCVCVFAEQKFLILIKSNLSIFFWYGLSESFK